MANHHTAVVLEIGKRRVFASAVEWPGWCRPGRDEEAALEALSTYAPRYAVVADRASVRFAPATAYDVVDRVSGDATTEFGAPGVIARTDLDPLTAAAARRQVALLRGAWDELDRVAVEAPETLRRGPRGGGRDRDAVVAHVLAAERSYARRIGVTYPEPAAGDRDAIEGARAQIGAALAAARAGEQPGRRWPPRYALRRIAWHVLDHVWEIEDKGEPG